MAMAIWKLIFFYQILNVRKIEKMVADLKGGTFDCLRSH